MRQLDAFLPEYEFSERHRVDVRASPERIDAAVREVSSADVPVALALFTLRGIRQQRGMTLLEGAKRDAVVLEDVPREGIVLGLTGRFWRPRGGRGGSGPGTAEEFLAFDDPDMCKAVIDFRVESFSLSTETRVQIADAAARRRFRRYWWVVRPFSGLIRILVLRAAKRRAEAG